MFSFVGGGPLSSNEEEGGRHMGGHQRQLPRSPINAFKSVVPNLRWPGITKSEIRQRGGHHLLKTLDKIHLKGNKLFFKKSLCFAMKFIS